jgi:hypothetical protein
MCFGEVLELSEQLRLADASRALDQEKSAASLGGVLEQRSELGELLLPLKKPRPSARSCFGNGGQLSPLLRRGRFDDRAFQDRCVPKSLGRSFGATTLYSHSRSPMLGRAIEYSQHSARSRPRR